MFICIHIIIHRRTRGGRDGKCFRLSPPCVRRHDTPQGFPPRPLSSELGTYQTQPHDRQSSSHPPQPRSLQPPLACVRGDITGGRSEPPAPRAESYPRCQD